MGRAKTPARNKAKKIAASLEAGGSIAEAYGEPADREEEDELCAAFLEGLRISKVEGNEWGDFAEEEPTQETGTGSGLDRSQFRNTCRGCGEEHPDHKGSECKGPKAKAKAVPSPAQSPTPSDSGSEAVVDYHGNRLPKKTLKNIYVLLRTPTGGTVSPGCYYAAWRELEAMAAPEHKLPQTGYNYRKCSSEEEAKQEWEKQGHRRDMPVRHLP
jgi:hypothetical protein